jgi:hypothetical protein
MHQSPRLAVKTPQSDGQTALGIYYSRDAHLCFLERGRKFFLAAELFVKFGRKILPGVGNTGPRTKRAEAAEGKLTNYPEASKSKNSIRKRNLPNESEGSNANLRSIE